jgi:hypothetical protein
MLPAVGGFCCMRPKPGKLFDYDRIISERMAERGW